MEKRNIKLIDRKDFPKFLGKPVWYQSLSNINDFGWAFIHPDTVKLYEGGMRLGYCKLIKGDPTAKDFYNWNEIRIYERPFFHGICRFCEHWHKGTLTHCYLIEDGEDPKACVYETRYRNFKAAPKFKEQHYTVKTFLRALVLSGYRIK